MKAYEPKAKGRGIDRVEVYEDEGKSILITIPCGQVSNDLEPPPLKEEKRQVIYFTTAKDICEKIKEITGNDPVGLEPLSQ